MKVGTPTHLTKICAAFVALVLPALECAETELETHKIEFFERTVRPLLAQKCYECHSARAEKLRANLRLDYRDGWAKGGDSGPALVPGEPEASLIIKAVRYTDKDLQMPPKEKLSNEQVNVIFEWIKMGAPDPRKSEEPIQKEEGIDLEKGRQFWSFQPIRKPQLPSAINTAWPRSEIDRFILAQLETENIAPVPDADRLTLIRRAFFVLTGLPPSPKAIDDFLADKSGEAFEKVVDRLLHSPDYSECWARHWLDVARFAESSGGGRSLMLPEAWRYRDYVIDAYDKDKPFNRFVKEQIAGDLMPSENEVQRSGQVIATAFLALGPTNYEQQDKELLRMEVVDEQIEATGRAFLGMSLGCARCHDHKFDPVPTSDYYAMAGIFRSTKTLTPGNVSGYVRQDIYKGTEEWKEWESHMALEKELAELTKAAQFKLQKLGGKVAQPGRTLKKASELPGIVIDDPEAELVGDWMESTYTPGYIGDNYIHDQSEAKGSKFVNYSPDLPAAGVYEVRVSYTPGTNRPTNTPVTVQFKGGSKTILINQKKPPPIDGSFISLGSFEFEAGRSQRVTISNENAPGAVIADCVQFLAEGADSIADPQTLAKTPPVKDVSPETVAVKQARAAAQEEVDALNGKLAQLRKSAPSTPKAMSVQDESTPSDWHIHIRGGIRNLGPRVPRGFLRAAMPADRKVQIAENQSGRLELADWLSSPENPLTARVYVNRVWHHLFGTGLVRTTDNFGSMGERPSHPELLDYLAARFIDEGWSTRKLIRQIMLSRTWQLSVRTSLEVQKLDPENRLLSHAHRRQLDAEALRDSILHISGELDTTRGGLTINKIEQYDLSYSHNSKRRGIYVPAFRNALLDIFEIFDYPNPNLVAGRRTRSTLPTQALFLMNSPFVLGQSQSAAAKFMAEITGNDSERLTKAYRLTLGRAPTDEERKLAINYLKAFNSEEQQEAWSGVFHSLFASLDFRFVE
ncbi:MAG: DUF1553 domain-containing protein [Planctomycetota bacterium]|nr:DUF1553 domain-containing protein [Planctomycetota bacterium]